MPPRPKADLVLATSATEREAFLADVHVGIVSVANDDGGPVTVPIWYAYEPGELLSFINGRDSLNARLITSAGRLSVRADRGGPVSMGHRRDPSPGSMIR